MSAEKNNTSLEKLMDAAKEMSENKPSHEAVIATVVELAKSYPGFRKVDYEHNMPYTSRPEDHFLTVLFDGPKVFCAVEGSVEAAICIINDKMKRYFTAQKGLAA